MRDLNSLTLAESIAVAAEYVAKGFKRAIGFVLVEPGTLTASMVLKVTKVGKQTVKEPLISFMPFNRTDKNTKIEIPLYWDAVKFDGVNNSSGKSYKDLKVNLSDDLRIEISKPENFERECTLLSTVTKDVNGRDKAVITFVSWN